MLQNEFSRFNPNVQSIKLHKFPLHADHDSPTHIESILITNRLYSLLHSSLAVIMTSQHWKKRGYKMQDVYTTINGKIKPTAQDISIMNHTTAFSILDTIVYIIPYDLDPVMLTHHLFWIFGANMAKSVNRGWAGNIWLLKTAELGTVFLDIRWIMGRILRYINHITFQVLKIEKNNTNIDTLWKKIILFKCLKMLNLFVSLLFAIVFFNIRLFKIPKFCFELVKTRKKTIF